MSDAIEFHHGPREALLADPSVALVALVNLMVHELEVGNLDEAIAAFDPAVCGLLSIRPEDVADIARQAEIWLPQIQV